jgi:hypothetical protein
MNLPRLILPKSSHLFNKTKIHTFPKKMERVSKEIKSAERDHLFLRAPSTTLYFHPVHVTTGSRSGHTNTRRPPVTSGEWVPSGIVDASQCIGVPPLDATALPLWSEQSTSRSIMSFFRFSSPLLCSESFLFPEFQMTATLRARPDQPDPRVWLWQSFVSPCQLVFRVCFPRCHDLSWQLTHCRSSATFLLLEPQYIPTGS